MAAAASWCSYTEHWKIAVTHTRLKIEEVAQRIDTATRGRYADSWWTLESIGTSKSFWGTLKDRGSCAVHRYCKAADTLIHGEHWSPLPLATLNDGVIGLKVGELGGWESTLDNVTYTTLSRQVPPPLPPGHGPPPLPSNFTWFRAFLWIWGGRESRKGRVTPPSLLPPTGELKF